jgi:hypothetical protein
MPVNPDKFSGIGDLKAKLERLLQDDALRVSLGKTARQWIDRERSWNVAGQPISNVYSRVRVSYG